MLKERNRTRGRKNPKAFCRKSSILANGGHSKQHSQLGTPKPCLCHWAAPPEKPSPLPPRTHRTAELGEVTVETPGRESWWRSQNIWVVPSSSSSIPVPAQQAQASPVPSLRQKGTRSPGAVGAVGKPGAGSNQTSVTSATLEKYCCHVYTQTDLRETRINAYLADKQSQLQNKRQEKKEPLLT